MLSFIYHMQCTMVESEGYKYYYGPNSVTDDLWHKTWGKNYTAYDDAFWEIFVKRFNQRKNNNHLEQRHQSHRLSGWVSHLGAWRGAAWLRRRGLALRHRCLAAVRVERTKIMDYLEHFLKLEDSITMRWGLDCYLSGQSCYLGEVTLFGRV